MLREWWRYAPGDKERALAVPNPCQSTGAWYLEPTPMVGQPKQCCLPAWHASTDLEWSGDPGKDHHLLTI